MCLSFQSRHMGLYWINTRLERRLVGRGDTFLYDQQAVPFHSTPAQGESKGLFFRKFVI